MISYTRQDSAVGGANSKQVLVVACAKTYFALPAEIIRGIVRPEEASASVGGPCPLVDLGARFDLPGVSLSAESRVLLCGEQEIQQALRVDVVMGLTDVERVRIRPLPPHFAGPERQWFSGMFLYRDSVALVLNAGWLLAEGGGLTMSTAPVLELESDPAGAGAVNRIGLSESSRGGGEGNALDLLEESADGDDTPWAQL